ncbi:MAG: hypothetical protein IJ196_01635 [Prevotella sp.]|nr:hypothetical protein [Prevotella sp.]
MERTGFENALNGQALTIETIRQAAHDLHASVNQWYDGCRPYGFHLDMVAEEVRRYGHAVCACEDDVLPLMFGAFFHDSIEDARLTYNDVMQKARLWLTEEQALTAAEIVYALTNDKGRTRAERAGERYYEGIRSTPYAPFVKLCDRIANYTYSARQAESAETPDAARMKAVYDSELSHFLSSIEVKGDDKRFALPQEALLRFGRSS